MFSEHCPPTLWSALDLHPSSRDTLELINLFLKKWSPGSETWWIGLKLCIHRQPNTKNSFFKFLGEWFVSLWAFYRDNSSNTLIAQYLLFFKFWLRWLPSLQQNKFSHLMYVAIYVHLFISLYPSFFIFFSIQQDGWVLSLIFNTYNALLFFVESK